MSFILIWDYGIMKKGSTGPGKEIWVLRLYPIIHSWICDLGLIT